MARDPLRILLAVRGRLVEEARAALGTCVRTEAEAEERIRAFDAALRRDRDTWESWQDAHQFVEMTAARLVAVRADRQVAVAFLAAAINRSLAARAAVAAAMTAAETVEQLIDERAAARRVEDAKREQHVLDDIARARHRQRGEAC